MGQPTVERTGKRWVDARARTWADASLVSEGQVEAILELEHQRTARPPRRLTPGIEIAAYVGSVLALMGGGAAVARGWEHLGIVGEFALAIAVAGIGFTAGAWLVRLDEPGSRRLGGFLQAVGTGGAAMATAVAVEALDPPNNGWVALAAGLPTLAIGGGMWRNRDRPLQMSTAAIGLAISIAGVGGILDLTVWSMGLMLLAAGATFAGLALDRHIRPRPLALAIGGGAAFVGGFMMGNLLTRAGPVIALTIAVIFVTIAVKERLVPLLVLSVIGAVVATHALLVTTFTGTNASLVVSLLGLMILLVVMSRLRAPT